MNQNRPRLASRPEVAESPGPSTKRAMASRREVAEYLHVPPGTLEKWAHHGEGPEYVRVGRHTRYRWDDVERWLAVQKRGGGGSAA